MNVVVQELLEVRGLEVLVQVGGEGVLCLYNVVRDSHVVSDHWNR